MGVPNFDFQSWNGKLIQLHQSGSTYEESEPTVEFRIDRASEFWDALFNIQQKYKPYEKELPVEFWYRGHEDEDFVLLPLLIRKHYEKKIKYLLPQYQRIFFERFFAYSRNCIELGALSSFRRGNEQIEYIADMQHYSIPTNLLDWSENAGVSLYFATEEKGNSKKLSKAAAVYVLQPYLYNLVRSRLIKLYSKKSHEDQYKYNRLTADHSIGLLPNFSAHFDVEAKEYENYIFGPKEWQPSRFDKHLSNPLKEDDGGLDNDAPLFPLAIMVPRNNPRITSQRGTFLAFNLCELPIKKGDSRFLSYEHVELSRIQDFYLNSKSIITQEKVNPNKAYQIILDKIPFLYKIIIEPSVVGELRGIAATLGNKKATIYPELYHIGEEISASVS